MANFTPQQIEEFLQEFFDVVGTRQYVGARYVPIFGRKGESSIAWDNSAPYEPLTIVLYQGNSFTSRQYVPEGIDILNTDFWANTGNYNAQVEAYRQEVTNLRNDYTDFKSDLENDWGDYKTDTDADLAGWKNDTTEELEDWKTDTVDAFEQAIDDIPNILPSSAFDSTNTVKKYIDDTIPIGAMSVRNKQGGFNIIGEFDLNDYGSVQGCTWISGDNYIVGVSVTGTNDVQLFKWNAKTQTLSSPTLVQGYHDNSITYMPDTDELYICEAFDDATWGVLIPTITVVDYSTLTFKRRITVPMQDGADGIYALCYDRKNEVFYATLWRGSTEGKSNRIYKYNKTLDTFLGYIDLDDFTSRYTKSDSNQGCQYIYDDTIFEIYVNFGLIAGFDINTGARKLLFMVPPFANKYRAVLELESFAVNEDYNKCVLFTENGAFECGIYKDVYEDVLMKPITNPYERKHTCYVDPINVLDTRPAFITGKMRSIQDGLNYGTLNHVYTRVAVSNGNLIKQVINVFNFTGEISLGAVSAHNTINHGMRIVGSDVIVWGADFTADTTQIADLTTLKGCVCIYNSRVRINSCTFAPQSQGAVAIQAAWNTILMLSLASSEASNTVNFNNACLLANFGTALNYTGSYKEITG